MTAEKIIPRDLTLTQLDQRIKSLAGQERELLCLLIQHIQELHRRKGHLELGYPNLYSYLIEGVGYSKGSAHRRIEAARLVMEIPDALNDIKSGDLKLTQVALVQKAAREKTKNSLRAVTTQDKQAILKSISQHSFEHSQHQVAAFFDLPIKQQTNLKVQADESVRFEISIPKGLFEEMKQAQALISHAVPTSDWVAYMKYATELILKQKTKVRTLKASRFKSVQPEGATAVHEIGVEPDTQQQFPTVGNSVSLTNSAKAFTARQRKILLAATPTCQFRDPITDKTCDSRWFLQIDHKQSRWAGGKTTITNAQVLCAHHNRLKYRSEIGVRPV